MQNGKVKDIELIYHGYRIPLATISLQIALWLLVAESFGVI